jgi:hypothetical protein
MTTYGMWWRVDGVRAVGSGRLEPQQARAGGSGLGAAASVVAGLCIHKYVLPSNACMSTKRAIALACVCTVRNPLGGKDVTQIHNAVYVGIARHFLAMSGVWWEGGRNVHTLYRGACCLLLVTCWAWVGLGICNRLQLHCNACNR